MADETRVQLIIKAPYPNIEDHVVRCTLTWTVIELKEHLSKVYPDKPAVNEQKLIYCGRLLRDQLQLKEILRQENRSSVYTLHLVYSRHTNPVPTSDNVQSKTSQNVPQSPSTSEELFESPNPPDFEEMTGVRQRHIDGDVAAAPFESASASASAQNSNDMPFVQQLYANYLSQQTPVSDVPPTTNSPPVMQYNLVNQQMAAYQQLYANYYAQMLRNYQEPSVVHPVPTPPNYQANTVPVADNRNNVAPVPAPNLNVRMNAQGGAFIDDDDEGANRDWLDYFYLCCRGFVLFSVVYFYSSPERLLLVVGIALMAFFYQEGWLLARMRNNRARENQPNRPRQQPDENPNVTEEGVPQNQNENNADRERQEVNEIEAIMDGDDPPHAQHQHPTNNQNPALTFIMSFFSSLIPDPAGPVNFN